MERRHEKSGMPWLVSKGREICNTHSCSVRVGAKLMARVVAFPHLTEVQDELAATRADMETQTAEVEVLKRHVDELQSKLRSLTGGGDDGGGGSLSSDLADTYDEVMGEELRVMRESYEAKIEALKLQMTKEQRNASKAARTAAKEHSEVEAMLKMRVLSLEAERAALLGET